MEFAKLISEVVEYKKQAEYYKRLLSDVKRTILCLTMHDKKAEQHFERILDVLDKNGIKEFYYLNF